MTATTPRIALALSLLSLSVGCAKGAVSTAAPETSAPTPAQTEAQVAKVVEKDAGPSLERFASTEDLNDFLKDNASKYPRSYGYGGAYWADEDGAGMDYMVAEDAPMAEAEPSAAPAEAGDAAGGEESITNTQEQGVDEGGIVKTHGDHLVVLRRGRLFTVDLGRKSMRPISALSVSPEPGHDAWYDEMLIHDDTIVVVGFSYQANATEIGLFDIDSRGTLRHRDTFFLRSNDYYSSRNYASRLLDGKLVFYMPYWLPASVDERSANLPGVMPWNKGKGRFDDWEVIIDATEIYRPIQETSVPVLHTVVTCDLQSRHVRCGAQAIVGPEGRSFYVSKNAVYVWTHDGQAGETPEGSEPPAVAYRFPLAGGDPGALRVWGAPVDQFSFKESSDGFLNVLVMAQTPGDAMWGPEFADQDVAMMRVPTAALMDGVRTVNASAYVDLPEPSGQGYAFQNRFVGDHLLYGLGSGWGAPQGGNASVHVVPVSRPQPPVEITVPHGIDRIEAMGDAAVVVGSDGRDLHFTSLDLSRGGAVAGEFVQPNATQGELRSHGFFFKPSRPGDGMLGLPVRRGSAPGYEHLAYGSAEILFLGVDDLDFRRMGTLASDPRAGQDDRCQVSCVDWYGNARPIFYKGRVFALLGYELVEGKTGGRGIREIDRVNMLDLIGTGRRGVIWKDL